MFTYLFTALITSASFIGDVTTDSVSLRKVQDIVIYSDTMSYAAFPSIVKKPNGNLLVAFRNAPERKFFAGGKSSHIDPNSQLVSVESNNNGQTWGKPKLLFAHPYGGTQEPNLYQLRDGSLICTSYLWVYIPDKLIPNLKEPHLERNGFLFSGGYLIRSFDGGNTWENPIYPPSVPAELSHNAFGERIAAYNRGQMLEGKDGRLYWAVSAADSYDPVFSPRKTSNHLLISDDKGKTWNYSTVLAAADSITFNETSLYETPKGDIVAFLRTRGFEDYACITRSTDGGKTFHEWKSMGFKGHPLQAVRLKDNRVLLVYGYRHQPFGIRARILNAECTDFESAREFVIRDDGGNEDIGYPWAVLMDDGRVLVTYYFNVGNGNRHIAGSILEIID